MDFLINFNNNTTTALPSKLIDYLIISRPVLNIKRELDMGNTYRFLNGDYHGRMILPPVENYYIENVYQSFLDLTNATDQ